MTLLKFCKINTGAFWVFRYKRIKTNLLCHSKKRANERQQAFLPVKSQCFFGYKFPNPLLPGVTRVCPAALSVWGIHRADSHGTERNFSFKSFMRRFHMYLNEALRFILLAIYELEFSLVLSDRP